MRSKLYPTEYLALLTVKYEVDADKFFNALVSAWKNQKAKCGKLSIKCRIKQNHKAIFLITQDSKVIAQCKIPEELLTKNKNPIKEAQNTYINQKNPTKKHKTPQTLQIKDLHAGMKHINLTATVTEITKPKPVITKYGNYANVANATLTDKTGKIKLCLWNNQINTITTGKTIQIQNAHITTYKNEKQIHINKNSTIQTTQTPPPTNKA